jgi:hypothetical protein
MVLVSLLKHVNATNFMLLLSFGLSLIMFNFYFYLFWCVLIVLEDFINGVFFGRGAHSQFVYQKKTYS